MSLIDSIAGLFHTGTKDWIFGRLAQNQLPAGMTASAAVPVNTAYIEIVLRSARVVNVRSGLNKFYGAVHSYASLPLRTGGMGEFNYVSTPANLQKVDATRLDTVVSSTHPILGPVPYRSAPLKLEVGLFSVKEADLVGPFLKVLGDLSSAAGVGFTQQALPFVAPLTSAINLFAGGAADVALEIGVNTSLSTATNPLQTGWYAVMRAEKDDVDFASLKLKAPDFRLVDANGKAVADYPYLVFEVAATAQRDDFFLIKNLKSLHLALCTEVNAGRVDTAQEAFVAFKRAAILSDDLILADAQRIVALVKQDMEAALPGGLTSLSLPGLKASSRRSPQRQKLSPGGGLVSLRLDTAAPAAARRMRPLNKIPLYA